MTKWLVMKINWTCATQLYEIILYSLITWPSFLKCFLLKYEAVADADHKINILMWCEISCCLQSNVWSSAPLLSTPMCVCVCLYAHALLGFLGFPCWIHAALLMVSPLKHTLNTLLSYLNYSFGPTSSWKIWWLTVILFYSLLFCYYIGVLTWLFTPPLS